MSRHRISPPPPPPADYDVVVRPGALAELADLVGAAAPAHRYGLVTDAVVAPLLAERVQATLAAAGHRLDLFVLPAGEASKTRETWARLHDELLARGFGRDACLIALGGGVVGDLVGFAAATYLRGIPVVQVPTTLLAMVDASIGGKTGVDTPAGKNLVGAFHHPRIVVMDPEVLRTLPPTELRAGLAEAVKHGAIADVEYFGWIRAHADALLAGEADALAAVIEPSVRIKSAVVAEDPYETGPRKALNFGHTVGHGVESALHYEVPHGYAVAIGMVVEAAAGEAAGVTRPGTTDALRAALDALGLPTTVPEGTRADEVLAALRSDKKARASRVHYALIRRIGETARTPAGEWTFALPDDVVARSLGAGGGPL
ncbi:MAG TPA: 3-dehydroquinate synthase [Longimicrobiales bacterium]|nr:3-dehydroquinate synthase [Longimicrobiales bacterium]